MAKDEKYITLKEAAEMSGYAPDYVGQLIRKGKLPGKQVYHAVAWMTTEVALREYLEKNKTHGSDSKGKRTLEDDAEGQEVFFGFAGRIRQAWQGFLNRLSTELGLVKFIRLGFWVLIVFLAGFFLLLFYIFSVRLDKELQERAIERMRQVEK